MMRFFRNMYCLCITTKYPHSKLYVYGMCKYNLLCIDKIYKSKFFDELSNAKKQKRKINKLYGNKSYKNIQVIKISWYIKIWKMILDIFRIKLNNGLIVDNIKTYNTTIIHKP